MPVHFPDSRYAVGDVLTTVALTLVLMIFQRLVLLLLLALGSGCCDDVATAGRNPMKIFAAKLARDE